MTDELRLSKTLVNKLNRRVWTQSQDPRVECEPGSKVWATPTGHFGAVPLIEEIRASGTNITAWRLLVGDIDCLAFPPSELPALAKNGLRFAKEALRKPDTWRVEPPSRVRG
jgi:hypothetical protein